MSVTDYNLELLEVSIHLDFTIPNPINASEVTARKEPAELSGQKEGSKAAFIDITNW